MPWFALGGAVVGLLGANKAEKSAEKAAKQEAEFRNKELGMQQEQIDIGKERYADWKGRFDPLYEDVSRIAYDTGKPDLAAIQADYGATMDSAMATERRDMARYGMSPEDGAWGNRERAYGLSRATGVADTANKMRQEGQALKYDRLRGLSGMIAPIAGGADSMMSNGYAGASNALQGAANSAGVTADRNRAEAGGAWQGVGASIGTIASKSSAGTLDWSNPFKKAVASTPSPVRGPI
jgi:hypothetical protein